ncbi:hypothetical protein TVAG_308010 [Trichomonas vaginalis G3]|uniref:RING-type domain-containing protein n=1 Tax=Trichomonas vaginalis (strain ATCC PRA-98 / G3) TaxID=412133 RepID=A2EGK0_TRIV3|nr:zinc finger, RING/FYVE/PHD-type domain-containing protein [Trichomonas vaginalis G3]EAY08195.1 hypothetical protein TVAG_308010 [Trichomonas vaginalis G3]KAI5519762.1 zinc finger, RING/FYVE/PHD-type domain-containing protein [Trichomonas vaginalis G3]|eukprot:XP_001320418.1 hypothetical protein [Trichomonas vaginalis G3]
MSQEVGITDCHHKFCKACIEKWIQQCSECPLCRSQIKKVRFFKNSFYSGKEIDVEFKKQQMPDYDDISMFIDDNPSPTPIIIDSDSDDDFEIIEQQRRTSTRNQHYGTTWQNGHRISYREHDSPDPCSDALRTISNDIRKRNELKKLKLISDKAFNMLLQLAKSYVMNGFVNQSDAFNAVNEVCSIFNGTDFEENEEFYKNIKKTLQRKLIVSCGRSNSSGASLPQPPAKRKLIPLSEIKNSAPY